MYNTPVVVHASGYFNSMHYNAAKRQGMSIAIDQQIILWLDHYIHN